MSLITKVYETEPGSDQPNTVFPTETFPDKAMEAIAEGKNLHQICLAGALQPGEAASLMQQCDILSESAIPAAIMGDTPPITKSALVSLIGVWLGPSFPAQKFVDLAVANAGGTYADLEKLVKGEKEPVVWPKAVQEEPIEP